MGIPTTRDELLAAIHGGYVSLTADLARVPADRTREATMPGHVAGTLMSPSDLVAYLIGWNRTMTGWFADEAAGREPVIPAAGYTWRDLGALAQSFYAARIDTPWHELQGELGSAYREVVELVESRSDDDLYGRPWFGTNPAGRMIQFNSSSPYANARRRIRAWLKQPQPSCQLANSSQSNEPSSGRTVTEHR